MAKIIYDGKVIKFDKNPTSLRRGNRIEKNVVSMKSGKYQDLVFYNKDIIGAEIRFEQGDVALGKMLDFWRYGSEGGTFTFHVDDGLVFYHPFVNTTSIDGGSISFTRSEDSLFQGSYFDTPYTSERPILEFAENSAPNQPRLAEGKFYKSLLIERGTINYLVFDVDMTNFDVSISTGITAQSDIYDPAGGNEAYFWDIENQVNVFASGGIFLSHSSGMNIVGSVYGRSLNESLQCYIEVGEYNSTGSIVSSSNMTLTTEWKRMHATYVATNGFSDLLYHIGYLGSSAPCGIYLAFPQFETFSRFEPTSFAKPLGGPSSRWRRGDDVAEFDLPDFNTYAGTICMWVKLPLDLVDHQNHLFGILNSDSSKVFLTVLTPYNKNIRARFHDVENNTSGNILTATVTTYDDWNFLAIRWEFVGQRRGMKINWKNSVDNSTDTVERAITGHEKDMRFVTGKILPNLDSDGLHNIRISDLAIFNYYLSDAQINSYYDSGKPWGFGRNIWTSQRLSGNIYEPDLRNGIPYYQFNIDMEESE